MAGMFRCSALRGAVDETESLATMTRPARARGSGPSRGRPDFQPVSAVVAAQHGHRGVGHVASQVQLEQVVRLVLGFGEFVLGVDGPAG